MYFWAAQQEEDAVRSAEEEWLQEINMNQQIKSLQQLQFWVLLLGLWREGVNEDIVRVSWKTTLKRRGQTDDKLGFICHTFVNGTQTELTAFRQKYVQLISIRDYTHTHLHTRSVILWTHNFGGIIHFQEEIFKQKHKVVAPRYWSCSGNKASCRPRSIKFNNRASAKKR